MSAGSYYLFSGDNYYPCGGACDFQGCHHTLEAAERAIPADDLEWGWWHVTGPTMVILKGKGKNPRDDVGLTPERT